MGTMQRSIDGLTIERELFLGAKLNLLSVGVRIGTNDLVMQKSPHSGSQPTNQRTNSKLPYWVARKREATTEGHSSSFTVL
jgi:hypothetical protein